MKSPNTNNHIFFRACCVGRGVVWWSLVHGAIPGSLPRVHSYLPSGFGSMEDILRWLKKHNKYEVYSFDVFDTLLRRRIDPPELLKRLAAGYLSTRLAQRGIRTTPDEILTLRSRCEEMLRGEALSSGKDADYHLDRVMAETLKALKADIVLDSREVVSYEIGLEKKAAQPMPGSVAVLSYLKSIGKRLICVSDSHLSTEQMAAILESKGLMRYIDKLYVSCEHGKRKSTGKLFQYVTENEGSELIHVGDNYASDYSIPKRLGIKALRLNSRSEQRRESALKKLLHSNDKMNYVNSIVGTSDLHDSELRRVGYEVLGPALTVFVHNVAEQAKKDDVETLFFVARDGYALKKIYEILQSNIYVDASLPPGKYPCLSRFPVRLASLHSLTYAEVQMSVVRSNKRQTTFADVLNSYGLEPAHFTGIAKSYQFDITEPVHSPSQEIKIRELLGNNDLQEMVKEKGDEARELLRDYLTSIGFLNKRKVALVDANVEGLTQTLLERAFANDRGYPIVQGYYFNVHKLYAHNSGLAPDLSQVKGIVGDWRRSTKNEQDVFSRFGILVELFSHPNHGITVGYKRVNGKVMPVFKKTPQENLFHLTSQCLQGILSYARDYGTYYSLHNYRCEELLPTLKANLKQWMTSPPRRDAEALRGLFLTSDWPKESNQDIVRQVTFKDIITVTGLLHKVSSSLYPQATLALSPLPRLSRLIFKAATYGYGGLGTISRMLRARHIYNARGS